MDFLNSIPTGANAAHVPGGPLSAKDQVLESGAAALQEFKPLKQLCAHLNAFHVYVDDKSRHVETNHYCAHLSKDVRQCILYDSDKPDARLIGIEYMVTPRLFETLPLEERKFWHSHVFEVKSGMLIMPGLTSSLGPRQAWEAAEHEEMKEVIELYGKVYHLWQTDRGDSLPLGEPKLMTSFTAMDQFQFEKVVGDRDKRFDTDWRKKQEQRKDIKEPTVHKDVDQAWK